RRVVWLAQDLWSHAGAWNLAVDRRPLALDPLLVRWDPWLARARGPPAAGEGAPARALDRAAAARVLPRPLQAPALRPAAVRADRHRDRGDPPSLAAAPAAMAMDASVGRTAAGPACRRRGRFHAQGRLGLGRSDPGTGDRPGDRSDLRRGHGALRPQASPGRGGRARGTDSRAAVPLQSDLRRALVERDRR